MEYSEMILDLYNRVVLLEKKVNVLEDRLNGKNVNNDINTSSIPTPKTTQRDKTRYLYNGNVYLKNQLVLAIVKDYVSTHPHIDGSQLMSVFDKSLQGSIGVVEYGYIARKRTDYKIRFFTKDDQIIKLNDFDMYVCSQWGILNINQFITRAETLGYHIEKINKGE